MKFLIFIAISVCLSGCVSRVQIAEIEAVHGDYFELGKTTTSLLQKGLAVGNGYLNAADSVATRMDGASVAAILLAAGAATAVVNGASDASVLRAGIVGVTGNQLVGYYDPRTAKDALTRAANRNFCIVSEGSPYAPANNPAINGILAHGFNSVRIALRADLDRDIRGYSDLFSEYRTSVEQKGQQRHGIYIEGRMETFDPAAFKQRILDCIGGA